MFFIKIYRLILKILFTILSPIIFILVKILKPFVVIRFIPLLTSRLGHLSLNPEVYLLEKKEFKSSIKYLDLFFTSHYGICNYELLKLRKKKIKIYPYYLLEPIHNLFNIIYKSYRNEHTIPFFTEKTTDPDFLFEKYEPSIQLTNSQNRLCESILLENGIDINSIRFACLFNRDDAYFNSFKYKKNQYYLSHHNYPISQFTMATESLANRDVYVFRMGAKVEGTFNLNNPKIIDYANSKFRSELMDIYLASKCLFGIACGTGSSAIAQVFRKPMLDLNANLLHIQTFWKTTVMLSKHYYSKKKNKNLTLKEICNYEIDELRNRNQLDDEGIEMINCSQQEITDATLEILDRIEGKWSDTEETIKLQNKFKSIFEKNKMSKKTGMRLHGSIIKANYSNKFLLKNKDWLN